MSHPLYDATIPAFTRSLQALDACLDKAQAHADSLKCDIGNILSARLAPDMFPLSRQIQIACDFAKSISSRMAGVDLPSYEDNEVTLADFKVRIAKTIAYINTITPAQFEGSETRAISIPMRDGSKRDYVGAPYLHHMGLPNFYFHLTSCYAVLRNNGVQVGKKDFIGGV
jgi:uncharacterized protein